MNEQFNLLVLKFLLDRTQKRNEKVKLEEEKKEIFFKEKKLQDRIQGLQMQLKKKLLESEIHFCAASPWSPQSSHDSLGITKMVFMANIMKELSSFVQNKLRTNIVEDGEESVIEINQKLYILTEEELLEILERF